MDEDDDCPTKANEVCLVLLSLYLKENIFPTDRVPFKVAAKMVS